MRCGFQGRSKLTIRRQNWRLRPSPAASVESSTWALCFKAADGLVLFLPRELGRLIEHEIHAHLRANVRQQLQRGTEVGEDDQLLTPVGGQL